MCFLVEDGDVSGEYFARRALDLKHRSIVGSLHTSNGLCVCLPVEPHLRGGGQERKIVIRIQKAGGGNTLLFQIYFEHTPEIADGT